MINRDTQLCMSLAGRPGNFGTRFHNYLYEKLGLNFIYKAFTTQDIEAAVKGVRALGIRGCAVSMPFKESCMSFLDAIDPSAKVIDSVNTIVNDNGKLIGFNTDYIAVKSLIIHHQLNTTKRVMIRGSGGMGKAVIAAFRDAGFSDVIIAQAFPHRLVKILPGGQGLVGLGSKDLAGKQGASENAQENWIPL